MKWSFKKQPKGDVHIQDVEAVEVVSVMADAYPDRDPSPEEIQTRTAQPEAASSLPAQDLAAEPAPASPSPAPSPKKKGKPLWKKSAKAEKLANPSAADQAENGLRPLKVLIGFLPDSSQKDTYFYMLGVAQKNLDSENIGWAGLTRFENGYAYEIHEGGAGRGYLESILNHFRSLPPFSAEETHRAFIRTATRTVRVERTSRGLYAVVLPESDATPQSDWLVTGKKLTPLVEKRTGLFLGGIVIFLSSLIAMMGGYATRYQPYTPSQVSLERVPVAKLPHSQWGRLTNLPSGDYVMALKFEKNEWLIQTPSNKEGKAAPVPATTTWKPEVSPAPKNGSAEAVSTGVGTTEAGVPPSGTAPAGPVASPPVAPTPTTSQSGPASGPVATQSVTSTTPAGVGVAKPMAPAAPIAPVPPAPGKNLELTRLDKK